MNVTQANTPFRTVFRSYTAPSLHHHSRSASKVLEKPRPSLSIDISARFGMRLRQLRRDHNLTQTRMATVFGIDRSFISDVERGRKSISLHTLEVLALGLNMSLSDLLKDV